ncbi:MAG TPA: zinc-dependent metalloprotease family protein [Chitinophagaceae bacterium]|nr:zinc-dependent metalloprotease family protein [Chitinophagaceae bacterium]
MKKLPVLALLFIAACSKKIDQQASVQKLGEKQSCDFGMKSFNLTKRSLIQNAGDELAKKKRPTSGGSGGGIISSPSSSAGVILLDFDGQLVSGTAWNTSGDFYCNPANLTSSEITTITQRVINDYSPFNVTVTTDESVYNAANIYRRIRVIITESWEWYGKQVGGATYLGSFTSGTSTPSFVFSSLLYYDPKYVAEAVSHEVGHSLGLHHQSLYDASCTKVSEYNYGQGTGEIGWAPIMGSSYSQNLTLWHNGQSSLGCTSYQDDLSVIASIIGYRTDDYSNTTSGAAVLTSSADGIINGSSDLDFFSVNISTSKTVSLTPFNVGPYNAGANTDLVLRVYDGQGGLISTIQDPNVLNAGTVLNPGSYFISVGTTANIYASVYGMLGRYNVSVY